MGKVCAPHSLYPVGSDIIVLEIKNMVSFIYEDKWTFNSRNY